jgi:hypothetical protein
MKFYFSGVEGEHELSLLRQAGVSRILVDPVQMANIEEDWQGHIALDSGAYRYHRRGMNAQEAAERLATYSYLVEGYQRRGFEFDFVATFDDLDSAENSHRNWEHLEAMGTFTLPIWHYGEDEVWLEDYLARPEFTDWLREYLEDPDDDEHYWHLSEQFDKVGEVGLGGLAARLHTKASTLQKRNCRREVIRLCRTYPRRFRLFGACDVRLLNAVKETALSGDSSLWLRGRKYGALIYEVNGKLNQLTRKQQRIIHDQKPGKYPEVEWALEQDGDSLSIANARNLERYFNAEG